MVTPGAAVRPRAMETQDQTVVEWVPGRRALLGVALGACSALALGWAQGGRGNRAAGTVKVWCADRDRGALYGLDRDLLSTMRLSVSSPVGVAPRPDGGAWVLSASQGDPLGVHRVVRIDPHGQERASATFGAALDLVGEKTGDALVLEFHAPMPDRVWRVDDAGSVSAVGEAPGLQCLAAQGGAGSGPRRILAGAQDGVLRLWDALGTELKSTALGSPILDLAPGPEAGSWWALAAQGGGKLLLLEPDLTTRWEVQTKIQALHLAPRPGVEEVWLASTTQSRIRRYGAGGILELDAEVSPVGGLSRGTPWIRGGVLFTTPGALVHFDRKGKLRPGQGGFHYLTDVAAVE